MFRIHKTEKTNHEPYNLHINTLSAACIASDTLRTATTGHMYP